MAPLPRRSSPRTGDLTNIGTTVPPVALPPVATPGMPVARFADEKTSLPVARIVVPDPLWTSRWQNSATVPLSKAPFVVAYRWWSEDVAYETWGPVKGYRIDMKFKGGHEHAYCDIPKSLWLEFVYLTTSVGQWLHQKILGKGWNNKNGQCNFRNFPI